jgi:hypothetical protein
LTAEHLPGWRAANRRIEVLSQGNYNQHDFSANDHE